VKCEKRANEGCKVWFQEGSKSRGWSWTVGVLAHGWVLSANIGVHLPCPMQFRAAGRISLVDYCATDGSGIEGQEAYLSECMVFIPRIRRAGC
jgi:hypothetical protein